MEDEGQLSDPEAGLVADDPLRRCPRVRSFA